MNSAICTLFEGDYHYGVAALTNSLSAHNFRGTIWVGYRGPLPPWVPKKRSAVDNHCLDVIEGVTLQFIRLKLDTHLNNYKSHFILNLWEYYCPDADAIFYFDPDIVVKERWQFFEEWVGHGIALCEDGVYGNWPDDHPYRAAWRDFAAHLNHRIQRPLNRYYNAGFAGFLKDHRPAVCLWRDLIDALVDIGINPNDFKPGDRSNPFFGTDQDALNLMAMVTNQPLSTIGPEGMDFAPGGYTMSHAATNPKPWRKRFTKSALSGFPPTTADKAYLAHSQAPIRLYNPTQKRILDLDARLGAAIGRFIRKS